MTLLHPLSKFLVTSHNSGDIKIWDTASNFLEMRAIPKAHAGPIYKISMWRRFLVSAGSDKTVKFWNPETWTCVANGIGGHGKAIYDIWINNNSINLLQSTIFWISLDAVFIGWINLLYAPFKSKNNFLFLSLIDFYFTFISLLLAVAVSYFLNSLDLLIAIITIFHFIFYIYIKINFKKFINSLS